MTRRIVRGGNVRGQKTTEEKKAFHPRGKGGGIERTKISVILTARGGDASPNTARRSGADEKTAVRIKRLRNKGLA